jgi:hypothetical protein
VELTADVPEDVEQPQTPASAEGPSEPPSTDRPHRRVRWWVVAVAMIVAAGGGTGLGRLLPRSRVVAVRAPVRTLNPPPAPAYAEGEMVPPFNTPIPDPAVLVGRRLDYLYTSAGGLTPPNIPARPFRTLEHLGQEVDALPTLPPWTQGGTWAPDVRHVDGRYVMWFSAPNVHDVLPTGAEAKCLGVATSNTPLGPFVAGAAPVVCDPSGSIDPRTFLAPGGQLWLYWKADTNAAWGPAQDPDVLTNMATTLWAQRLAPDGITLIGQAHEILAASALWEHKLIEAPDMIDHDGHYYLFFSSNPSYQDSNGIAVAFCRGPEGPCREPYNGPLLGSNTLGLGPGEESLFTQGNATWVLYSPTGTGFFRQLAVARIAFGPRGPYIAEFAGRVPGIAPVHRSPSTSSTSK